MKTGFVKVYKIISIVILGLCIYGFLLPLISPVMEKLVPNIWICPFLRITGTECPFCGVTKGVSGIYRLDIDGASTVSLIIFLVLIIETAFRTMIVLIMPSMRERTLKSIVTADVTYHALLVVLAAVYVIIFIVTKF
ncbi:MAG: DUF2752 domain-containing protein [Clostridia bacterium]|nr:DUF2752 domain-containing protein [Clostridia bacterium]